MRPTSSLLLLFFLTLVPSTLHTMNPPEDTEEEKLIATLEHETEKSPMTGLSESASDTITTETTAVVPSSLDKKVPSNLQTKKNSSTSKLLIGLGLTVGGGGVLALVYNAFRSNHSDEQTSPPLSHTGTVPISIPPSQQGSVHHSTAPSLSEHKESLEDPLASTKNKNKDPIPPKQIISPSVISDHKAPSTSTAHTPTPQGDLPIDEVVPPKKPSIPKQTTTSLPKTPKPKKKKVPSKVIDSPAVTKVVQSLEKAAMDWSKFKRLGKGNYGTVYEVGEYAVKLAKGEKYIEQLATEYSYLTTYSGLHIVIAYGFKKLNNGNGAIMVLERLYPIHTTKISVQQFIQNARVLLEGIAQWKKNKFEHGDIKHDNILENAKGEYKLIDPLGMITQGKEGDAIDLARVLLLKEVGDSTSYSSKIKKICQTIYNYLDQAWPKNTPSDIKWTWYSFFDKLQCYGYLQTYDIPTRCVANISKRKGNSLFCSVKNIFSMFFVGEVLAYILPTLREFMPLSFEEAVARWNKDLKPATVTFRKGLSLYWLEDDIEEAPLTEEQEDERRQNILDEENARIQKLQEKDSKKTSSVMTEEQKKRDNKKQEDLKKLRKNAKRPYHLIKNKVIKHYNTIPYLKPLLDVALNKCTPDKSAKALITLPKDNYAPEGDYTKFLQLLESEEVKCTNTTSQEQGKESEEVKCKDTTSQEQGKESNDPYILEKQFYVKLEFALLASIIGLKGYNHNNLTLT